MPRYSSYETYGDGSYRYDDRYDAGEFNTYGTSSRGPSSGEYYYEQSPYTSSSHRSSSPHPSRSMYDTHGYAREGSFAGEEDLRRRHLRWYRRRDTESSYGEQSDPRTRLGRDDHYEPANGRRSGLSQEVYTDDREPRQERRHADDRARYRQMLSSAEPRGGPRLERRGAITSEDEGYAAYARAQQDTRRAEEASRGSDSRGDDPSRPSAVYGLDRSQHQWFPSYEFR